jgi:hypothetical protein
MSYEGDFRMRLFIVFLLFILTGCHSEDEIQLPAPSPTPTIPAPSPKPTPTPTPTPEPTPTPPSVDHPYIGPSELQPYVNKFVDYGMKYGRDLDVSEIIIQFGNLSKYGSGVIGLCELSTGSNPTVTLNDTWWDKVDDTQRLLLVLHELGHCSLYRMHLNTKNNNIPVSIMYPLIISSSTYLPRKNEYDKELYTSSSLKTGANNDTFICTEDDIL